MLEATQFGKISDVAAEATNQRGPLPFDATETGGVKPYAVMLHEGLSAAAGAGFDVQASLQATYGNILSADEYKDKAERVTAVAASMAESMQLAGSFFEKPSRSVLLIAIADSWDENEQKSIHATPEARDRLVSEREMLVDFACMLGGKHAAEVRDIGDHSTHFLDRYIEAVDEKDDRDQEAFLEKKTDTQLSKEVQDILAQYGAGSFLERQRSMLGIHPQNEQPFVVRVLNMADDIDFHVAHVQEKPIFPDWRPGHTEEEKQQYFEESDAASAVHEANKSERQPFIDNLERYRELFGKKLGDLPPAFCHVKEGQVTTLYLRATQGKAILKYHGTGRLPSDEIARDDVESVLAIIRHEYAHTQKQLTLGVHSQIGMCAEERKAELVSGNRGGYNDIKYLFQDLMLATGVDMLKVLENSLKEDDAASAFVLQGARQMGLRNILLLTALKPLPYEMYPEHAKAFIDMSRQKRTGDRSSLDLPMRETIERFGLGEVRERVVAWVDNMQASAGGTLTDFHEETVPSYREHHGLGVSSGILLEEVRKRRKAQGRSA